MSPHRLFQLKQYAYEDPYEHDLFEVFVIDAGFRLPHATPVV